MSDGRVLFKGTPEEAKQMMDRMEKLKNAIARPIAHSDWRVQNSYTEAVIHGDPDEIAKYG